MSGGGFFVDQVLINRGFNQSINDQPSVPGLITNGWEASFAISVMAESRVTTCAL